MKTIKILFLAFILIGFTSCSSDDGDSNPPSDTSGDLVGTWVGETLDYTSSSTTTVDGQTFTSNSVGEAFDVNYTITFSENPNEFTTDGSYSVELITTAGGQTQTDIIENLETFDSGTWTRDGNTITVVVGETQEFEILELTDTTLRMSSHIELEITQQGITYQTVTDANYTYTRM